MWGSLDEPEKVPPKGEFFCKSRTGWMPELEGRAETEVFANRGANCCDRRVSQEGDKGVASHYFRLGLKLGILNCKVGVVQV